MRLVPVECVKEGCFLAKSIFDDDGRVLLREGVKLNDSYIQRVKALKIYSLYIIDEYSDKEIEDTIKPELRQKSVKKLKDTFLGVAKLLPTNLNPQLSKIHSKVFLKERQTLFDNLSAIANDLMEELLNKKNVLVNLVDIKSMDNYTYQHCINVAVLSLILGLQLQLNRLELRDLCMGALVHDIGKILIPKEILLKDDVLSEAELDIMRQHSAKGYDYIKTVGEMSAIARIVVLQHHERFDGRGYPDGKRGTEIHRLARITAIADVYDALTSDRPYRRALSPNEAIEYIMGSGNAHFDFEMVQSFAKIIVPFPEGSLVKLSNGDYAVVEEVFQSYPLRPTVKIVKSEDQSSIGNQVSLMEKLGVVISENVYELPN